MINLSLGKVSVVHDPTEITGDSGINSVVGFPSAAFAKGDDADNRDFVVDASNKRTWKNI